MNHVNITINTPLVQLYRILTGLKEKNVCFQRLEIY